MTDREIMKMALEALIASHPIANTDKSLDKHSEAMSALRQALAQGEQTPYAVGGSFGGSIKLVSKGEDQSVFGHKRNNHD